MELIKGSKVFLAGTSVERDLTLPVGAHAAQVAAFAAVATDGASDFHLMDWTTSTDGWTGVGEVQVTYTASADVQVNFWILVADESVSNVPYSGS